MGTSPGGAPSARKTKTLEPDGPCSKCGQPGFYYGFHDLTLCEGCYEAEQRCQSVALGKNSKPRPCPFRGVYDGLYGLVLCGHHLRVYERAVTRGEPVKQSDRPAGRAWRDRLYGFDPPEPVVAPQGPARGVYQGFYAA